jgi:glucose/mannose-6-phosphate isomerase
MDMMEPLDDSRLLETFDKGRMLDSIVSMPKQIEEAVKSKLSLGREVESVCICGMGGSAIGGDILADYAARSGEMPLVVVRGIELPRFVGKSTLAIMISYSGETWETLELFDGAVKRGAQVVSVTSGGELGRRSKKKKVPLLLVPTGQQPRAALGYLMGASAVALSAASVAPAVRDLRASLGTLNSFKDGLLPSIPLESNQAKKIANRLNHKIPVVYAPRNIRSVALRWQTQINENAKMMAFSGEYPEMNHNHMVGWAEDASENELLPVFLIDPMAKDLSKKIGVTAKLIKERKTDPVSVKLAGRTILETSLTGILLGDFVSYYLAALKGIDPSPVASIAELKKRMTKSNPTQAKLNQQDKDE